LNVKDSDSCLRGGALRGGIAWFVCYDFAGIAEKYRHTHFESQRRGLYVSARRNPAKVFPVRVGIRVTRYQSKQRGRFTVTNAVVKG